MKLRIDTITPAYHYKIKPGINLDKCITLMKAAYFGFSGTVKKLIQDPEVDVNFWGYVQTEVVGQGEYHTPLSLAACANHLEIVSNLLQHGAQVEAKDKHYGSASHFKHVIDLDHYSYRLDLDVIKLLLHKQSLDENQIKRYLQANFARDPRDHEILYFFLTEAVIRGDKHILKIILTHHTVFFNSIDYFNTQTFQAYTKDFGLSKEQILNAYDSINFLYTKELISQTHYLELNKFLVDYSSINYPGLILKPLIVEQSVNILELENQNILLKQKVADLESRLRTLENELQQQKHCLAQFVATHSEQSPPVKTKFFGP